MTCEVKNLQWIKSPKLTTDLHLTLLLCMSPWFCVHSIIVLMSFELISSECNTLTLLQPFWTSSTILRPVTGVEQATFHTSLYIIFGGLQFHAYFWLEQQEWKYMKHINSIKLSSSKIWCLVSTSRPNLEQQISPLWLQTVVFNLRKIHISTSYL